MVVKAVASTPCLLCQDSSSTLDSLRSGRARLWLPVLFSERGQVAARTKGSKRRGADENSVGQEEGSTLEGEPGEFIVGSNRDAWQIERSQSNFNPDTTELLIDSTLNV